MIKNIVFDLGRVLVDFYPLDYLETFNFNESTKNQLNEFIFESKEWYETDRGTYPHISDLIQKLCSDHPELSNEINLVLQKDWVKMHKVKPGSVNFLKDLKKQGYSIYILSNLSNDSYNFISKLDFFQLIDGGIFSYQLKLCKPDRQIYEILLNKYNLIPEETIFIDDKKENIEAANALKIHGVQFINLEEVISNVNKIIKSM